MSSSRNLMASYKKVMNIRKFLMNSRRCGNAKSARVRTGFSHRASTKFFQEILPLIWRNQYRFTIQIDNSYAMIFQWMTLKKTSSPQKSK